jgi:hypothetical protein
MKSRLSIILIQLVLFLIASMSFAQPPEILWQMMVPQQRENGPAGIELSPDGNMIVALNYRRGPSVDFRTAHILVKMTPNGSIIWSAIDDFSPYDSHVRGLEVDSQGRPFIWARIHIPWSQYRDYIYQLGSEGVLQWQRHLSTDTSEVIWFTSMLADNDILLGGLYNSDIELVRLSPEGNILQEIAMEVIYPKDSMEYGQGWLVMGVTGRYAEMDLSGNIISYGSVGGSNEILELRPRVGNESGFAILCVGDFNQYILKHFSAFGMDPVSTSYQVRRHPIINDPPYVSHSVPFQLMPDGGYLIGGHTGGDEISEAKLIRVDSVGTVLWEHTLVFDPDTRQAITDLILLPDGRIQVLGLLESDPPTSWLIQLAAEGEVVDGGPMEMKPFDLPLYEPGE